MERIGTGAADDMVVAAAAEDRVIAAVAKDEVVAEGDTIQHIDGFGVVRSFHESHDSLPFLVRAKFHNRSITGASICPMGDAAVVSPSVANRRRRPRACDLVHTIRRHAL